MNLKIGYRRTKQHLQWRDYAAMFLWAVLQTLLSLGLAVLVLVVLLLVAAHV